MTSRVRQPVRSAIFATAEFPVAHALTTASKDSMNHVEMSDEACACLRL